MESITQQPSRLLIPFLATLQFLIVFLGFSSPEALLGFCLVATGWLAIVLLARDFERVMFLLFLLVAWFPEFSQTEDAWSAADFQSLYNYRPIPAITASVFDYAFVFAFLIWLFRVAIPCRRTILRLPLCKPMLGFLAVSSFSLVFGLAKGYPSYYALREFRVSAYFVLTFLMWITTVDTDAMRLTFCRLLLGAALVVGVYGVIRYALGLGKEYYDTLIVYYDIADSMLLYLGLLTLASAWYATRKHLLGLGVLAVPMIFSLLLSYRRGAWIAFGAGSLVLMLLHPSKPRATKRRIRLLLIPALLGILAVAVLNVANKSSLFVERTESIVDTSDDPSNVFRIMDAMNALSTFAKHPIVGIGFGGRYDLEYYSAAIASEDFWDSVDRGSHNGYLFILYKMGLIGFTLYLLIFWKFIRVWFQARRTLVAASYQQALLYGCGVGAIAILVNNMTSPVTDSLRPAILLAVAMGCVVSLLPTRQGARDRLERV